MRRYSEYKDSGVEWIGDIPSHWDSVGFTRYIDSIVDYRGKTPEKVDEGVFLVTTRNIKNGKLDYSLSQEYVLEEEYKNIMSRGIPENGDVLFTMEAPLGEVANVDNTNIALAQRIIKLRGKKDRLDNYYLKYWILSSIFQQNLYTYATGSTALGIKSGKLHKLTIVLPTIQEQYRIVEYLDKKTLQIETLISKKEELIETLKTSRTKLISETVTKGLYKDVPMKDSGVEWIGEIPSHWEVNKLRYLGNLQNGISKSAEEFGFGYPFVSYGNVHKNSSIPKEIEGLVNSSKEERRIYSVTEGDVFFTRTSETIEEIGFASTCLDTIQDATFAGFLIRFRQNNNKLYKGYSKYYFRSDIHRKFFVKEMNLVTRASLGQGLLKNLPVVIPSYEEQIEISNYLDKQVTTINNIILKTYEQIEVLKKAKQKLITEVVTGKIDVTNL